MDRNDYVLSALAAAGAGASFQPVHVQKLFFLLDKEASHLFEGPHFTFRAYDYGPFDRAVYSVLDSLASEGLIEVETFGSQRRYCLSAEGFTKGNTVFSNLPPDVRAYLQNLTVFVKNKSFRDLVKFVYARYPEMKERSVFVE